MRFFVWSYLIGESNFHWVIYILRGYDPILPNIVTESDQKILTLSSSVLYRHMLAAIMTAPKNYQLNSNQTMAYLSLESTQMLQTLSWLLKKQIESDCDLFFFCFYFILFLVTHWSLFFLNILYGCYCSFSNQVSIILSHINPLNNIQQILVLQQPSYLLGTLSHKNPLVYGKRFASKFFVHVSALFFCCIQIQLIQFHL